MLHRNKYFIFHFHFVSFSGIFLSLTAWNVGGESKLKARKEHSHENSIAFTYTQIHLSLHNMWGICFVLQLTQRNFFLTSIHFNSFHLIHIFDSIWHTRAMALRRRKQTTEMWWRKPSYTYRSKWVNNLFQCVNFIWWYNLLHLFNTSTRIVVAVVVMIGDVKLHICDL